MKVLTDTQLMLLQIIHENTEITGYDINKLVIDLKYRDWADIRKTAIYTGLKALKTRGFVKTFIDINKTGKGPIPRKYSITDIGKTELKKEMIKTIEVSREREKRFDLVISSIQILSYQEILDAFDQRIIFLKSEFNRVAKDSIEHKDCIPLGGQLLYSHIISSLENEILFSETTIHTITTEKEKIK